MAEAIQFSVVKDELGFQQLEADWRALSALINPIHFCQTFDWCWQAWRHLSSKKGRHLRIIVGRVGGQAVLILPLMMTGPYLRFLGSELFEFYDVLVTPGEDRNIWIRSALNYARQVGASALLLRDVRQDSDLAKFLDNQKIGGCSRISGKTSFIQLSDFPDWQTYFEALPKHLKSDQRRQWKRLAELPFPGRFEIIDDREGQAVLLRWLHSEKIKWLDMHKGTSGGGYFGEDNYQDFFFTLMPMLASQGLVMMCRIVSGDEILAAALGFRHQNYFAFFMFAYDPKWSTYSPGRLIMAKTIEWCFEHNLRILDMLFGPEDYKAIWSTHTLPVRDYFMPLNFQGKFLGKWHSSGISSYFSRVIRGRLAAQRKIIAEMKPL